MAIVLHQERLEGGHRLLKELVRAWETQLPSTYTLTIAQAGRTDGQQMALWCMGRTAQSNAPCTCPRLSNGNLEHPLGHIVTEAKTAAESAHGYRWVNGAAEFCAIDAFPLLGGQLPTDPDCVEMLTMCNVARRVPGIACGRDWLPTPRNPRLKPDRPHYQVADWKVYPYAGSAGLK